MGEMHDSAAGQADVSPLRENFPLTPPEYPVIDCTQTRLQHLRTVRSDSNRMSPTSSPTMHVIVNSNTEATVTASVTGGLYAFLARAPRYGVHRYR